MPTWTSYERWSQKAFFSGERQNWAVPVFFLPVLDRGIVSIAKTGMPACCMFITFTELW